MAWRDTLSALRDELAQVRAERQQQAAVEEAELQEARRGLSRLADSLGISDLLSEMNATLVDNRGKIETIASWDSGPEDSDADGDEDDDDDDGDDVIVSVLSWEEDGEREIAVEVVSIEHGTSVQVNGVEVRPDREALEQALLEAFRDELEL